MEWIGSEQVGQMQVASVRNVKWLAGKPGFKHVVLHSFTHMAKASASPGFADALLQGAANRLRNSSYELR
jgi:hypothetical protein